MVYEDDQVITGFDLIGIRNGYVYQYHLTPWYWPITRLKFRVGIGVVDGILGYLKQKNRTTRGNV